MALHLTPEEHDADPPAAWQVVRIADRCWHLDRSLGGTIGYYTTRRAAEAGKVSGPWVRMYEQDGRWFAGHTPPGWRSYAECKPGTERAARMQQ